MKKTEAIIISSEFTKFKPLITMKKIIVIFFLFSSYIANAQQDALFTQYMFNKLLVNPAYAGSREKLCFDMLNRSQWVNIEGAPETFTFSGHTALHNKRVGLGFYMFRDKLGPTNNMGFMGTYSYRIFFANSSLAFGLQFGFKYFDFDWNAIKLKDKDLLFEPMDVRKFTPDANFGIYYQSNRYFLGISSKQLLQNEFGSVTKDGKSSFSKLTSHFYFMGGTAIPIIDKIIFRPSLMAKFTPNAPLQVDLNSSVLFNDFFWIGISYRTGNAVAFMTEFKINDKLKLGYSYDLYLNELQPFNYGSHEIRIGFELPLSKERMITPRYF
jgi:type IX secretion system PorP/SprF family membrane protein